MVANVQQTTHAVVSFVTRGYSLVIMLVKQMVPPMAGIIYCCTNVQM